MIGTLLRLYKTFSNPGIKGWVPADKWAVISKGSQHLLIKRCVCPDRRAVIAPSILVPPRQARPVHVLCGSRMETCVTTVSSKSRAHHSDAVALACRPAHSSWFVGESERAGAGWGGLKIQYSAPGLVPVSAEIGGVWEGQAGRAPHELVKHDGP